MADSVFVSGFAAAPAREVRHQALVRVTHWVNALSFAGLLVSGIGIILAHPRFYWGETGGVGTDSLFDLPLPFMLGGPSGWGRYLHFQSAWLCVLNGLLYVGSGLASARLPAMDAGYQALQRVSYLMVIFGLFPLMIWTGLAMSPAVTSVFPFLVNALGGHQSARTIHFFGMIALVLFLVVHVAMVWRTGFRRLVGGMITGKEGL
jgi:thiosulfate reductase cytochrome b subunit